MHNARVRSPSTPWNRLAIDATGNALVAGGIDLPMRLRDFDVRLTIERRGLNFDSVPSPGAVVLVRSAGTLREGSQEIRTGYTEDVTNVLCEAIITEGRRASLALDSEFCGVDIITVDPTVTLRSGIGSINEINTTAALHHRYNLGNS